MSLTYPVRAGDLIADKYVIEHRLGRGSSGLLFAARHEQLNQQVAIKFLRPELARRPENGFRFRQQASAAAGIEGERVCRVLDVGTLDSGIPYLVMEYLEGRDLASELVPGHRRPFAEAVECILFAAEGLAEALAAGVVHADLEPSKLYWAESPDGSRRLKLLGLGAAAAEPLTVPHWLTTHAEPLLTEREVRYLAPEQRTSKVVVDSCSNVWTLGAILFELLSGRPFSETELPARRRWSRSEGGEVASAQTEPARTDPPLRPSGSGAVPGLVRALAELDVHLPDGLAEVLARALAPSRVERYASVVDFALALAPFASFEAQTSIERITRLVPATPESRSGLLSVVRRRVLLAAAGLAVLGFAIHLLAHAGSRKPERSDARAFSADAQLLELAKKLRGGAGSQSERSAGSHAGAGIFYAAGSRGEASAASAAGSESAAPSGGSHSAPSSLPIAQLRPVAAVSVSSSGGSSALLVAPQPSTVRPTRAPERPSPSHYRISAFGGRR